MAPPVSRRLRLLAAAALPALAGASAPAWAMDPAAPEPVSVTVTDKGCAPATLSVPAGKITFRIKNASRRALEWEILQGVRVVEERENIVPGFVQTLTATLEPGDYKMTCGLLSNPQGVIQVAAKAGAATASAAPDLSGLIAQYRTYVAGEVSALASTTHAFVAAVKGGDVVEARRLYAPAHQHYERIEPIAELFNDLDSAMDARADDFEKKEADPTWTGFHRIEKALFADGTTAGMAPVADKLEADVQALQSRLDGLEIKPKDMVGGAAELIEEVASKKISGEEDRYSRTDLWDFQANVDGAQKIVALLRPTLQSRDPQLLTRIDANFGKVDTILTRYKAGDGFESYDALTQADRRTLKGPVTVLAEDLSKLRGVMGVD